CFFFFSSRRRHTRCYRDWSSDVCSSDLTTEKEVWKLHSRGIFSVTQLSYTFRARRRPKRFTSKSEKYSHALKALAIRERKIHIRSEERRVGKECRTVW